MIAVYLESSVEIATGVPYSSVSALILVLTSEDTEVVLTYPLS